MMPQTETPDRPTRILYLITDLHTGGVPLHLHRLATSLDRNRFAPLVVSLAPPGPVAELLERDGLPTRACSARHALDLRALFRLRDIIRRFQPDLIHALLFHANIASRLVGPLAGVPSTRIINEVQTVEVERRWHLLVDQLTWDRCAVEIGNSPAVVEHLCHRAGIPAEHLLCIPGGIDPARFDHVRPVPRTVFAIPDGASVITWVGRMDPAKRVTDLLDALALIDGHPPPHLLLVGDGPQRQRVNTRAAELRLTHRVHMTGFRGDVPAILAASDVFALPSITEGTPNALLEAMAASLPVVTCDVPGCRDVVRHRREGLLVPPRSPPLLARAIRTILSDRTLAACLGSAARTRVVANYSQVECHRRYVELYTRWRPGPNIYRTPHPVP